MSKCSCVILRSEATKNLQKPSETLRCAQSDGLYDSYWSSRGTGGLTYCLKMIKLIIERENADI